MKLPKISIITPSFNQAEFLDTTIESVLSQEYPNLEYIIIDGGSSDDSVKILKKYGKKIIWISESDDGQTDAINKGLKIATGDIIAYINSDDIYSPDILNNIAKVFSDGADWVTGDYEIIDEKGIVISSQSIVTRYKSFLLRHFSPFILKITNSIIPQPSTFWSRKVFKKIGKLNKDLQFTMDYDYWLRVSKHFNLTYLPVTLSSFRLHGRSKSQTNHHAQFKEELATLRKNGANSLEIILHRLHTVLTLTAYKLLR